MAKDVMEVLKSMAACYETERQSAAGWRALEALSELIAADVDYDDSRYGLARARYNGSPVDDSARDCARAEERRAAALAACRGLA
jgi:hypothetical protein